MDGGIVSVAGPVRAAHETGSRNLRRCCDGIFTASASDSPKSRDYQFRGSSPTCAANQDRYGFGGSGAR